MTVVYSVFLFMICILKNFDETAGWSHNDERIIRKQILQSSEYDRLTRPKERTIVKVALNLLTINFLDIKSQTLSCTGWLTVEWEDERLKWNMTTGSESENIYALNSEIWYPELFIDNSLADVNIIITDNLQYRVNHNGFVFWEIPRIFITHCEIDVTYFPYDTQSCVIEVTSWAYSTKAQILEHLDEQVHTNELVQNGEWIYQSSYLRNKNITEQQTDGTNLSLSQLDFVIVLERRPLHYVTTIIIPTVIISYLSVIVFILPTQSGEKASYTLTVFLALAVLLTFIQDQMPPTALHVSYLSVYLSTCLGLNAFIVLMVVCIIRIHNQDHKKKVPECLQCFACCIAKICCYHFKEDEDNESKMHIPWSRSADDLWKERSRSKTGEQEMWRDSIKKRANLKKYKYYSRNVDDIKYVENINEEHIVSYKTQHQFTWTEIADITDWFLFVIMNLLIIILTLVFLILIAYGN